MHCIGHGTFSTDMNTHRSQPFPYKGNHTGLALAKGAGTGINELKLAGICRTSTIACNRMGAGGLEPPQLYGLRILSPLRLPIPPCPQAGQAFTRLGQPLAQPPAHRK